VRAPRYDEATIATVTTAPHAFVAADLRIERFEEPETETHDFPNMVAIRARR